MTRLRVREPIHSRYDSPAERARQNSYAFILDVDDNDFKHGHDDAGHAFSCTREQLMTLRRQINEILGRAVEPTP